MPPVRYRFVEDGWWKMSGVFAYCRAVVRMRFAIREPAALRLGKPLLYILVVGRS